MIRALAFAIGLLTSTLTFAQQAFVFEVVPDQFIGILIGADGSVHPITKLTIFRNQNPPVTQVTKATYVYDKDQGPVPAGVASGLQKLNHEGKIAANEHEVHSTTGSGSVPAQFKSADEAARKAGLPALVVQAGEAVVRVIKAPKTEAEVMEAVK